MSTVFSVLPGLEVPADAINKSFADMWTSAAADGRPSPTGDDAKATQINLVLHLGFGTTHDDAVAQFQTTINFSRRYPCRVVVLCPYSLDDNSTDRIRAKIYGECHLGKTKGDTRCCEFVMLAYPMSARRYLESQVSICLSTDLPLYYWVHRFASSRRLNDYQYLLVKSERVILDSAVMPEGFGDYAWPRPEAVRDLAHARTLPVRQSIGQFLSACPPAGLVDGISAIRIARAPQYAAEAAALLKWARDRLIACGMDKNTPAELTSSADGEPPLSLNFEYKTPSRHFHWRGDPHAGTSGIDSMLCHGPMQASVPVSLLTPEAALGEAMFF
ncbi:hypothetical protein M2103_000475 [Ereboglobus sp. PH5-5]|uniref:glucose-6-phosphate dehydrogenase assembly protein OpcA n=1 Tax=unclassified Ereboglobus TaxID=2626932 RepID=UPI0024072AC7|nr:MULTISPECIES: glucose-6-phosphate dehydrogenase assembly protein OpcA [unclassified Ereboglobus]MDF9828041.1 hypothetical protein [Ereboglobus sp. PH5-10]MDF9832265.1 hypothetical protein [Ereboglobus sp. PH5-5]